MGRIFHLLAVSLFLLISAYLLPIQAHAGWSHDPAVNTAITTRDGYDTNPAITDDGAGGAIIAWMGLAYDIYIQRIDANGNLLWGANGVVVSSGGDKYYPQLVSDGSGGAIITWQVASEGSGIYVQRVNADGIPQWDTGGVIIILNNEQTTGNHQFPRIVSDGSGGAIIAWQDSRNGDFDIYAQWIDADGFELLLGGGMAVCTETGNQEYPQLIAQSVADVSVWSIITWQDARSGVGNKDIYAQRLIWIIEDELPILEWDTDGIAVCDAPLDQQNPQIVSDGSGGAIITWMDGRTSANEWDIFVQRIDASGDIKWTPNGVAVSTGVNNQQDPRIVSDGSSGAVIAWWGIVNGGNPYGIFAQRVDSNGVPIWTANGVTVATPPGIYTGNYSPQIAGDGNQGAVVTWAEISNFGNYDIHAQRISSGGVVLWTDAGIPVSTAANDQLYPKLASAGSGGATVVWQDGREEGDIYAQKVLGDGTLPIVPPTVTTAAISIVTATSATAGGNITSDGGSAVNARGICWGTDANPELGGNCISAGSGSGSFAGVKPGLTPNTPYHARSYATNAIGTSYGSDIAFSTNNKYGLNLTFAGTGSGTVSGGGATCGSACTLLFEPNTTAQLQATTTPYYFFTSWSGACSGASTQCSVIINSDNRNITATFTLDAANSVRIKQPTETRYPSIGDAIRLDADGKAVIDAWGCELSESPIFDRGAFTLKGGWNQPYSSQSGTTTINGTLTVKSGSVTVENLAIR